jgi:S1-C subfamily serine protease
MRKIFHQVSVLKMLKGLLIAGTVVSCLAVSAQTQTVAPATLPGPQATTANTSTTAPERAQPRRPPRKLIPPATVTVVADQARVAPQVVTIVHRLSGVKMLRYLLRESEEPGTIFSFETDDMANDAHASIVAGWALADGKTIAVRLPQAGAEMEFARTITRGGMASPALTLATVRKFVTPGSVPDLTVITRDGRKLRARYVGLDAQTGLSMLQVNTVVMPPLAERLDKENLTQGQDVQIFAPERTSPAGAASARNVYVKVGEVATKIFGLTRSAGKLEELTVRGAGLSPLVIGGIACDRSGQTLGIVESIEGGDARVVPADKVRAAARRVLERQASVPRPLLGIIGEPVEFASRSAFLAHGWRDDQLPELLQKNMGILLTAVKPGTPAALAKLHPGDVIVRVNQSDVQNSDVFSQLLGEAGSGRQVQFLIWRPSSPAPFQIDVKLGGSFGQAFKSPYEFPALAPNAFALEGLGVETMTLSSKNLAQLGAEHGVLVLAVEPESIAARSGLKEGDVIESIDGQVVRRGGAWAAGFDFNRRKKHVVSLVRKREKKQVVLDPVE